MRFRLVCDINHRIDRSKCAPFIMCLIIWILKKCLWNWNSIAIKIDQMHRESSTKCIFTDLSRYCCLLTKKKRKKKRREWNEMGYNQTYYKYLRYLANETDSIRFCESFWHAKTNANKQRIHLENCAFDFDGEFCMVYFMSFGYFLAPFKMCLISGKASKYSIHSSKVIFLVNKVSEWASLALLYGIE